MKRMMILIAAACLLVFCLTGSSLRTEHEIIKDLVLYHGCYDELAVEKEEELLQELKNQDPRQGELWTRIMDYWTYANTDLPVNTDALPEDLPKDDSLCITALGFELNDDGTMKEELLGRLQVALSCAQQYPNAYVLCTGGGTARKNPNVTEAGLMGAWLLEQGLDEERLILEDQSHTTAENARFSYDILCRDYPQVNSIVIVSSSYHIAWGSLLFEAAFMEAASEKQTPELHVISNCAFPTENKKYKMDEILRWQTGGMFSLIDEPELTMQFYRDYEHVEKPPLN